MTDAYVLMLPIGSVRTERMKETPAVVELSGVEVLEAIVEYVQNRGYSRYAPDKPHSTDCTLVGVKANFGCTVRVRHSALPPQLPRLSPSESAR